MAAYLVHLGGGGKSPALLQRPRDLVGSLRCLVNWPQQRKLGRYRSFPELDRKVLQQEQVPGRFHTAKTPAESAHKARLVNLDRIARQELDRICRTVAVAAIHRLL